MKFYHFDIKKKNCESVSYLKNGQICVPNIQDMSLILSVHFLYKVTETFISHVEKRIGVGGK